MCLRVTNLLLAFAIVAVAGTLDVPPTQPQQIYIGVTGLADEMTVTWLTMDETATSTVKYSTESGNYTHSATGTSSRYVFPDPLPFYRSGPIHRVLLTGLQSATKYFYTVGDVSGGWSAEYSFTTEDPNKWPIHIGTVGDIGYSVASREVFDAIAASDAAEPMDLFVHPGDISYANGNQTVWDVYGNLLTPTFSHVPYMLGVGNHEAISLFIPYNARFNMPSFNSAGESNMYYSFNYRNIHFLALDSEQVAYAHILKQYNWMVADLAAVNRTATPWVVAYWHTPWYCSNVGEYDHGLPMRDSYEDAFYQYRVDVVWNGHVHAYERTARVYRDVPNNNATEYFTVGMGGNHDSLSGSWMYPAPDWSVYREANFGYSTFDVYNNTHAYWKFIRSTNATIGDETWIVRDYPRVLP